RLGPAERQAGGRDDEPTVVDVGGERLAAQVGSQPRVVERQVEAARGAEAAQPAERVVRLEAALAHLAERRADTPRRDPLEVAAARREPELTAAAPQLQPGVFQLRLALREVADEQG